MDQAHEIAEKIEHAAHGGGHGHGGGIARLAGITMAILGVMLALCAAMVGGARTELIATMVEQSNTFQKYQAQRMKHRLMLTQLAALHALSPSHAELRKFEEELAEQRKASGKGDSEDAAEIKSTIELSTKALVEILQPRAEDEKKLVTMTKAYAAQTEAAHEWVESYEPAVKAHSDAAEHFELGQLAAEIGIVIASVALLVANRKAWFVSVAFGTACAVMLGWTYVSTTAQATRAEHRIAETRAAYEKLRESSEEKEDEEIVASVEKKIAEREQAEGAPHPGPAPKEAPAHHD